MYKLFGSKEIFNENDKIAPIKLEQIKSDLTIGAGEHTLKIVCISDTHSKFDISIPKCDLFIHAGDIINYNEGEKEMEIFYKWIKNIDAKYKIVIGGNHDKYLQNNISKIKNNLPNVNYLEYNSFEIKENNKKILIYGAPCTIRRNLFYLGNAYSISGEQISREWKKIPENIDILITHLPPYEIFDKTFKKEHIGSKELRNEICNRIHPKIHIFGHNHDVKKNSMTIGTFENGEKCLFVNANCNLKSSKIRIIEYKY